MITGSNKRYGHGHGGHGAGNDPSHIERSHISDHTEYRELNFRAIVQFMVALFAVVALSYLSMYGMMKVFQWEHEDRQPALSPVVDTAWNAAVKPDVQIAPHVDLTNYRHAQDTILEGKRTGTISIDEAIKQVATEGLPYRQGTAPTAAAPQPQSATADTTAAAPAANDTTAH